MFSNETIVRLERRLKNRDDDISYLRKDKCALKVRVKDLEADAKYEVRVKALDIEKAKNEIRLNMNKALVESDLKRVKAEASLATYEKMDTKAEREHINKMLEKAIDGLSKAKVQVIK